MVGENFPQLWSNLRSFQAVINVKFQVLPKAKFHVPVVGRIPRRCFRVLGVVDCKVWNSGSIVIGGIIQDEGALAGEALDNMAALRTTWRAEKEGLERWVDHD